MLARNTINISNSNFFELKSASMKVFKQHCCLLVENSVPMNTSSNIRESEGHMGNYVTNCKITDSARNSGIVDQALNPSPLLTIGESSCLPLLLFWAL